ncbi:RlpA-like double-psi beta-barrel-protein domain-containing protein-containing protein, partial [Parasitella parasitica]
GLGSCGVANKESDMIVALNANQMTESYSGNPNNNPLCGKKINVRNPKNGREVTVKVQDTCPGCPSGDSLDLSPGAFKKIASLDDGVIDIAWSWA